MVVVLGHNGQLGKHFVARLHELGFQFETFSDDFDIRSLTQEDLARVGARFVINCAAYTAVDKAESDLQGVLSVNTIGVGNVARACASAGATLFHFSSDYVFNGIDGVPCLETDPVCPLNAYGLSKLAGDLLIAQYIPTYYIFRLSWLFGEFGNGFVDRATELLRSKSMNRETAVGTKDEVSSPTYTGDVVNLVCKIISGVAVLPYGLYHFSGEGPMSRFDVMQVINEVMETNVPITPVGKQTFSLPARRADYSYLSKSLLRSHGVEVRSSRDILVEYLKRKYWRNL